MDWSLSATFTLSLAPFVVHGTLVGRRPVYVYDVLLLHFPPRRLFLGDRLIVGGRIRSTLRETAAFLCGFVNVYCLLGHDIVLTCRGRRVCLLTSNLPLLVWLAFLRSRVSSYTPGEWGYRGLSLPRRPSLQRL